MPRDKHALHHLKQLIEESVASMFDLPRPGIWFCVHDVECRGNPPELIRAWATIRFSESGSPFYLGETCRFDPGPELRQIADDVRSSLRLLQPLKVEFVGGVQHIYDPGIEFVNRREDALRPQRR